MLFPLVSAVLCAGCTAAETTSLDRFASNGRVIAMSGAEAGASNACFTCHGLDGQGDGAGAPRLAGLDAGYLERQLEAYADGRRSHLQMGWIARQLSAGERKAVAFHYAALPVSPNPDRTITRLPFYHRGDASRGLPACAACHGRQGQGIGPANPPIAGQPAPYLAGQLERWRKAKRRNDPGDVMLRISQRLTPAEVRALADYAAALPGGPPSPVSPAASRA
ncbi:MAG TPA: c-type cytochrome, partial [Sphingomicrobium sp.]|nr:c-type cytochrome [Sphingomicrobium sp.]